MRAFLRLAVGLAAATLILSACGGRPANPIAAVQPTDSKMNCQLLQVEYASNERRVRSLVGEKADAEKQNAAKAASVLLLGVTGLIMMDLKDSEQVEIRALQDRNEHLAHLMSDKRCPDAPPVTQPARASDTTSDTADDAAPAPKCKDVGGYEAYMKKTGKTCML